MKVHEYQARELLSKAGIPVPPALAVDTPEAAGQERRRGGRAVWLLLRLRLRR